MRQGTAFPTRLHVHPVKTQIRLCASMQSDQSFVGHSVNSQKDLEYLEEECEDSDQTVRILSLCWEYIQYCRK